MQQSIEAKTEMMAKLNELDYASSGCPEMRLSDPVDAHVAPVIELPEKTEKQAKKRKKSGPQAKKRFTTGYQLFCKEHRQENPNDFVSKSLGESSQLCSKVWAELHDDAKAPYIATATSQKAEACANMPKKAKRTASSYILFAKEHRKLIDCSNKSLVDISKECGQAWRDLTEIERNVWKEKRIEEMSKNDAANEAIAEAATEAATAAATEATTDDSE